MVQPTIHQRLIAGVQGVLAESAHPGLMWRATRADAWAAIVGDASWHPDRPELLSFSDEDKGEMLPNTGTLKVSDVDGNTILTDGQQIQAMGQSWSVLGMSRHNGKRLYRCKRIVPASGAQSGGNRGDGR